MKQISRDPDTLVAEPLTPGRDLVDLARTALSGDNTSLLRKLADISRHYSGPDQQEVRDQLMRLTKKPLVNLRPLQSAERLPVDAKTRTPLLQPDSDPREPLLLEDSLEEELLLIIEEFSHAEQLAAAGLETNNTLLLYGPPGTGKTHIARHLAQRLGRPLNIVRLDSVISSLLGDTAKNIRALFDFVDGTNAILFLDELDALAKFRDDRKELGELKRVVNTLLQGLDNLEPTSIVIGATNHPEILDPAIWRRFTHSIEVELPSQELRSALWNYYLFSDEAEKRPLQALSVCSNHLSCSDIREISLAARRRAVITGKPIELAQVTAAVLASETGKIRRPKASSLTTSEMEELAKQLQQRGGLRQVEIGDLLSTTRQHISKLLK
ncbi:MULTISPECIES: AAA family ATPase [Thalassospira]|jgi:SpoVK/Ycf46/Vps4 family AAA+-type ATPase|uniref:AAA family ATPase n=1 Tax=Thalassospira TaxID=168934 RepID=UPI0007A62D24|nr:MULTISPECIES: AAA family ATPase [Thalassospira]MAL28374.1 ATP-binding protein [Thalassospira sp.]MBL4843833.1 ATP-binding protein [Thalassospira sp.]MCD1592427.1 AAA family ATPase [Thalassospira xiamenensis]MCK2168463.1 AAA family ATPase [Thalassospira xiamenensis]PXX28452.1 ATPase family protein associated with various cellular activities (AAA) [Thalassospira sp. 11-3]|tara:strand:+ start:3465 stop:4613 length:1149 start_codon:yes stop_codon:yes gene_type:complete